LPLTIQDVQTHVSLRTCEGNRGNFPFGRDRRDADRGQAASPFCPRATTRDPLVCGRAAKHVQMNGEESCLLFRNSCISVKPVGGSAAAPFMPPSTTCRGVGPEALKGAVDLIPTKAGHVVATVESKAEGCSGCCQWLTAWLQGPQRMPTMANDWPQSLKFRHPQCRLPSTRHGVSTPFLLVTPFIR
jgi:hypothetical protein